MSDARRPAPWVAAGVVAVLAGHLVVLWLASLANQGDGLIRIDRVVANLLWAVQWVYVLPVALVFRRNRPMLIGVAVAAVVTALVSFVSLAS